MVLLNPLTFQDLIVNSPLLLLHISLLISYDNLVLDQDNNFCRLDKFGYSCYLFAGQCMDIIGRSYMLTISRSYWVKLPFNRAGGQYKQAIRT